MVSLNGFKRRGLVHQADRIERILSALELPAKIQGGQIEAGRVRYFLTPSTDIYLQRMRKLAGKVAEEMGVYQVRVSESEGNLVLDLPMDEGGGIRLLPLLEQIETPPLLTSIIGQDSKGESFSINFLRPESRHLVICGNQAAGKSEFLRTILFSIALHSTQTQVNFLAIDPSGNELSVVEALPHRLSDVASESQYGIRLLHWLIDEIERREIFRIRYPELFLFIDDVDRLGAEYPEFLTLLEKVIKEGVDNSVHIVAATAGPFPLLEEPERREFGVAMAESPGMDRTAPAEPQEPGCFRICIDRKVYRVQVAWMPAYDLHGAVSLIQSGRNRSAIQRGWVR